MKKLEQSVLAHIILWGILSSAIAGFWSFDTSKSLAAGSLIIFADVGFYFWILSLVLRKKLIALSILGIVSKYTLLAAILGLVFRQNWFEPIGFAFGLFSLVFAGLSWASVHSRALDLEPV